MKVIYLIWKVNLFFRIQTNGFWYIVTQIQGDQIDLGISGFTYSEDRVVEWSDPYLGTQQVAVVPNGSSITSMIN